jgi:hypothetical protein
MQQVRYLRLEAEPSRIATRSPSRMAPQRLTRRYISASENA